MHASPVARSVCRLLRGLQQHSRKIASTFKICLLHMKERSATISLHLGHKTANGIKPIASELQLLTTLLHIWAVQCTASFVVTHTVMALFDNCWSGVTWKTDGFIFFLSNATILLKNRHFCHDFYGLGWCYPAHQTFPVSQVAITEAILKPAHRPHKTFRKVHVVHPWSKPTLILI